MESSKVAAITRRWVRDFVVKYDLCPFAAPMLQGTLLRVFVSDAQRDEEIIHDFLSELDRIQQCEADEIATTLIAYPDALHDFGLFIDFVELCNELLDESKLRGTIQVASFHPKYQFADTDINDVSNFTNRAPFPTIHLIREAEITRVLRNFGDPSSIFKKNIETMNRLGATHLRAHLAKIASTID